MVERDRDTSLELRLARQLEAAQQITHIGSWEWDVASGALSWSDELYRIYGYPPRSCQVSYRWFMGHVHPDDRERVGHEVAAALRRGGRFSHRERIIRPDGAVRDLDTVGEVLVGDDGKPTAVIGTCRDITEELRREETIRVLHRLQEGERQALEMLAAGAPLGEVLGALVDLIEETEPCCVASILLLDPGGTRLVHGAARGLPEAYNRALDGLPIGARAGSCGTAAFRGEPVFVADITADPLWEDYRELSAMLGMRACWSTPIRASDRRVLGTFAIYHREARLPDQAALHLIARITHVAGIAIERRQLDDQLRALSDRIEATREEERTGIAREIHDQLGQALTAFKLDLGWIGRRLSGPSPVVDKLAEMTRAADALLESVRRISAELRPGILDDVGLLAAVEWQADEFAARTGIACRVLSDLGDIRLDRGLATAMFRIFQEALTNVARHAGATTVEVGLGLEHGRLRLLVADDGVGLPDIGRRSGLGLLGMRERARRLGGECVIRGREPRGTLVELVIPLRFPADLGAAG